MSCTAGCKRSITTVDRWRRSAAIILDAIDAHEPIAGVVYGLGTTAEGAVEDAEQVFRHAGITLDLRAVPCTAAAHEWIQNHGGGHSAQITVTSRGVCLRSEEQ